MKIKKSLFKIELEFKPSELVEFENSVRPKEAYIGLLKYLKDTFSLDLLKYYKKNYVNKNNL
jgi:hypothetical protein